MTVAALYVQKGGAYYGLEDVDPWDEERDARRYAGPWPVVAHPPCAAWCRFAKQRQQRHGLRVGDDGGCFQHAAMALLEHGGILEHPAHSLAWRFFSLQTPRRGSWQMDPFTGNWVTEVDQGAYGHPANKSTWLLTTHLSPPPLDWTVIDRGDVVQYQSKRQRSATPLPFRDLLLDIARSAR